MSPFGSFCPPLAPVPGILCEDSTIDNAKSIQRLAEIAVAYSKAGEQCVILALWLKRWTMTAVALAAEILSGKKKLMLTNLLFLYGNCIGYVFLAPCSFSGYHVVAPSDMMDNRVFAIKTALNQANLGNKVITVA